MRRRPGFTLVEMIVVISILMMLAALLLPVLRRARIQADRARTAGDLQVIGMALEAFRQDTGDYPRVTTDASILLGRSLVGQLALVSGGNYQFSRGYQPRPGGRLFGPYLQVEAVQYVNDSVTINNSGLKLDSNKRLLDHNSMPIQYLPAHPAPVPDPTQPNCFVGGITAVWNAANAPVLYPAQISAMLGDANLDGRLDNGEAAAYSGPFILWSAGPDLMWGPASPYNADNVAACDDVLNFR